MPRYTATITFTADSLGEAEDKVKDMLQTMPIKDRLRNPPTRHVTLSETLLTPRVVPP